MKHWTTLNADKEYLQAVNVHVLQAGQRCWVVRLLLLLQRRVVHSSSFLNT